MNIVFISKPQANVVKEHFKKLFVVEDSGKGQDLDFVRFKEIVIQLQPNLTDQRCESILATLNENQEILNDDDNSEFFQFLHNILGVTVEGSIVVEASPQPSERGDEDKIEEQRQQQQQQQQQQQDKSVVGNVGLRSNNKHSLSEWKVLQEQQNDEYTFDQRNVRGDWETIATTYKSKVDHLQLENEHLRHELQVLKEAQHKSPLNTKGSMASEEQFLQLQKEKNELQEKLKSITDIMQKKDRIINLLASKNEEVLEELTRSKRANRPSSMQDLVQLKEEFDRYEQLLQTAQGEPIGKQFRRLSQHVTAEMQQWEKGLQEIEEEDDDVEKYLDGPALEDATTKKETTDDIETLRKIHHHEITSLKSTHAKEIDHVNKKWKDMLDQAKQEHQREIENLRDEFQRQAITQIDMERQQNDEKISLLQQLMDSKIDEIQLKHENQALEKQRRDIDNNLEDEQIKLKEEKIRTELKQMYETEINAINAQWKKVIEDIQNKHNTELNSLSGQIKTEFSSKLRKEKETWRRVSLDMENEMSQKLTDMEKSVETIVDEELAKNNQEWEKKLSEQLEEKHKERNQLLNQLEGTIQSDRIQIDGLQKEVEILKQSKQLFIQSTITQLDSFRRVINALLQIESCKKITEILLKDSLGYQ